MHQLASRRTVHKSFQLLALQTSSKYIRHILIDDVTGHVKLQKLCSYVVFHVNVTQQMNTAGEKPVIRASFKAFLPSEPVTKTPESRGLCFIILKGKFTYEERVFRWCIKTGPISTRLIPLSVFQRR